MATLRPMSVTAKPAKIKPTGPNKAAAPMAKAPPKQNCAVPSSLKSPDKAALSTAFLVEAEASAAALSTREILGREPGTYDEQPPLKADCNGVGLRFQRFFNLTGANDGGHDIVIAKFAVHIPKTVFHFARFL